jgi:RNA polymerase sigma-70 factor (ECF subfamily)
LTPENSFNNRKMIRTAFEQEPPLVSAEAFEKLYRKSCLPVFRYLYAYTGGSRELAEDLAAEAFMRAWKNRTTYSGRSDGAVGWIIRIARNLAIDTHRRAAGSFESHADPLEEELDAPAALPNPETQVMLSEQQHIVLSLLGELPQEQREILILRYFLDWKIKQIARYMDFPDNTVSVYIRRALEKLRRIWPDERSL